MKKTRNFSSESGHETAGLGGALAEKILGSRGTLGSGRATIVALEGDLGAGKTTFAQGFARGLGIKRRLISPTFVIMRRYPIRGIRPTFNNLYHIDAYRLKKPDALETLGFKEILADPAAIVLIEWPKNVEKLLPRKTIWIKFQHGKKENERLVRFL